MGNGEDQRGRQPEYSTVAGEGRAEIVIKKSRFIAVVKGIATEEEGKEFLAGMRRTYPDARHHCHAMVIGMGGEVVRFSDDGEPGGTAGRPMLEELTGAGLTNVAAVVTRYFGGILLGTGGLTRAYSQAVKAAVEDAGRVVMRYGVRLRVRTDYQGFHRLEGYLGRLGFALEEIVYGEKVDFLLFACGDRVEKLKEEMRDMLCGKIQMEEDGGAYFPARDGEG